MGLDPADRFRGAGLACRGRVQPLVRAQTAGDWNSLLESCLAECNTPYYHRAWMMPVLRDVEHPSLWQLSANGVRHGSSSAAPVRHLSVPSETGR